MLAADTEWLLNCVIQCAVHMENCWGLVVVWLSELSGKSTDEILNPGVLGSILGNCQPFTFCFITSKVIYLQLKQDVLKIIMNTMLIQIVPTIDIPMKHSPGLSSLSTSTSNTPLSPDASGFVN